MIAFIYRGFVKKHLEKQYQEYWRQIATFFIRERGALSATLHKTEEGVWVAYSKWHSKKDRDGAWLNDQKQNFPREIEQAIKGLKACLDPDRQLPEISMEVVEEL